jgi:hypothetical protein
MGPRISTVQQPPSWPPGADSPPDLDALIRSQRKRVEKNLSGLVRRYYPSMMTASKRLEYRKMVELSNKMSLVGLACSLIAGYPFDARRLWISSLFGACCFLGDSFLDDFGEEAAREYLNRYELLITRGWFEIRNERERLFYVILSRLFAERDLLDVMLRQAIVGLYLSQKRDVNMRTELPEARFVPRRRQLQLLRECARDRSGHAITVLSLLLVPDMPLRYHSLIYAAGSLIMHIDDHGDCHFDRYHNRLTFMNQVKDPVRALHAIFERSIARIKDGLPESTGRDLLISFLYRYYRTRLRKHRLEKSRGALSWTVYE